MSVLIKGMKMPENCSECPVALSGKYCRINKTHTTYTKLPIRPTHCPLIALPDTHGRLVDADELNFSSMLDSIDQGIAEETVMYAPTIVEEEGEE